MFNNGAGNIFPANPPTCSAAVLGTPGVVNVGTTTNNDSGYRFVGYFTATTTGPDISTENMSLNTFLANNTLGALDFDPSTDGLFTGRYVYVHSNDGLIYIVALLLED